MIKYEPQPDRVNVQDSERWASAIGGAALVVYGAKRLAERHPAQGLMLSALGAGLVRRGATGHCDLYEKAGINTAAASSADTRVRLGGGRGSHVEEVVSILRPRHELYGVWRTLELLPAFMPQLKSVTPIDGRRSRWVAAGPGGKPIIWIAELLEDIPSELVSWRSVGEADMVSAGSVHFTAEPGGRGTQVRVRLQYDAAGGKLGAMAAKLFGKEPSQLVREGLRRFKMLMESGEIATSEGQPRGAR